MESATILTPPSTGFGGILFSVRTCKTCFVLNSSQHEAILLMNVKMSITARILTYINRIDTTSESS